MYRDKRESAEYDTATHINACFNLRRITVTQSPKHTFKFLSSNAELKFMKHQLYNTQNNSSLYLSSPPSSKQPHSKSQKKMSQQTNSIIARNALFPIQTPKSHPKKHQQTIKKARNSKKRKRKRKRNEKQKTDKSHQIQPTHLPLTSIHTT